VTDDDIGVVKLYRNLKTGKKFLFVKEQDGDYITAELNENESVIAASNRIPKYSVQDMLYDYQMESDHNTGFTYDSSKGFINTRKQDDNLDD
jgi:hypothetical protein